MICPDCKEQMIQLNNIGGGISNETEYSTWEIKSCPWCDRVVLEYYAAIVVNQETISALNKGTAYPSIDII